jgi:hypothetical protein
MMMKFSRVLVIAAGLALVPSAAGAKGGGHGTGGAGSSGHSMSSGRSDDHGDHGGRHDGDHDRDAGFAHSDDASNTGPCGMGWGWNDGKYCGEPSKAAKGEAAPTQDVEAVKR